MDVGSTISCYLSLNVETTVSTNRANVGNLKGLSHGGSDYVPYLDFCSLDSHDYSFLSKFVGVRGSVFARLII
jgi:hypothetical protein